MSQLPPKKSKSLILSTAFSASFISCLVIAVALGGVYVAQRRIYENRLVEDVKQNLSRVTAFIVGYFYAQNNWMHLEEAQTQLNQSPNVLYSYVVGSSGKIDLGLRGLSSPDIGSHAQSWEPAVPFDLEKSFTRSFVVPSELAKTFAGRIRRGESVVLIGAPIFCGILGKNCAQLRVAMSFESIRPTLQRLLGSLILLFILLGAVVTFAVYASIRRNLLPIKVLAERLHLVARRAIDSPSSCETVVQEGRDAGVFSKATDFEETAYLKSSLEDFVFALQRSAAVEKEFALSRSFADLASQVAHDIRSPLSALSVISDMAQALPEDHRNLLRAATNRISDIANHLLTESRSKGTVPDRSNSHPSTSDDELVLVADVVDSLVTEKRIEFRSNSRVTLTTHLPKDLGSTFSMIPRLSLERALSNIINNAVEAVELEGDVTVSVSSIGGTIYVDVSDNGKGIPDDVLPLLGAKGATFGKENGNGLGLAHAFALAEKAGGEVGITTKVGSGTTIRLRFPSYPPPEWFASQIVLGGYDEIVVVDDDPSIHQVWKGRMVGMSTPSVPRRLRHYSSVSELIKAFAAGRIGNPRSLYLMDFEFAGESQNGLQVIEELNLAPNAVLVSSRYEDSAVPKECLRLGVRLLPKFMAPRVPLTQ